MSNLGLYKACDREGIHYEKTAVGDKYVCENMMTYGHSLGGEQSGHIIFSKHATTGDGILTSDGHGSDAGEETAAFCACIRGGYLSTAAEKMCALQINRKPVRIQECRKS